MGRYRSRSAICGRLTEYTSIRPVSDPAMMASASRARKVMLPASLRGAIEGEAPGGRKRSAPEDGACPINERPASCAAQHDGNAEIAAYWSRPSWVYAVHHCG